MRSPVPNNPPHVENSYPILCVKMVLDSPPLLCFTHNFTFLFSLQNVQLIDLLAKNGKG